MARKKVALQYITNNANRRATFKKHRRGMIKKVSELATLCEVRACAVIYGPDEMQPEVWPSEHEARKTLQCFKAMPEIEQSKKMINQEGYFKQRLLKHHEQLGRCLREIHELEMTVLMVDGLSSRSFHDIRVDKVMALVNFLAEKVKMVRDQAEAMKAQMAVVMAETARDATPPVAVDVVVEPLAHQMQPNWFTEMPMTHMFGNDIGGIGTSDHNVDFMQPCMDLWNI